MIIYNRKLSDYLQMKNMKFIDLQRELALSPSVVAKFQKNRPVNTDTIDKICTYFHCQPGEIMEWVEDENELKEREIQAQIDELQKQLAEVKANKK